ncbi:MAG TPA: hypothetical protein PL182_12605 [Pseudobdellovibrionaceae bacterium]|nr:hypothetical protein [Pseudobdellovibrionaceae bacterium]
MLMGFVVVLLGAQTFRDTFGEDPVDAKVEGSSGRFPASIEPVSMASPEPEPVEIASPSESFLIEWNWNCGPSSENETRVHSSFLRFKGKACGGLKISGDHVSVTNETNGFTASVFAKGKADYETDLIQLREGSNRIRLQYVNSAGRRIESFLTVISRISALSSTR